MVKRLVHIAANSRLRPWIDDLGGLALFLIRTARVAWHCARTHHCVAAFTKQVVSQIYLVGVRSLLTVCFAGFFVGAILVLQYATMLSRYDATALLGGLNTASCIREVGPLIISFLLAGKIGAYTAAELGTMKVTEQFDAMRCLGVDPMEYLIAPRFVSILISSILLLVFGLMVSILGSMAIANLIFHIHPFTYMQSIPQFTTGYTVFGGFLKAFLYGTIVASVSLYKGFSATGGARGVGIAVTQCAVMTNLLIVVTNSLSSYLLEWLTHSVHSAHVFAGRI